MRRFLASTLCSLAMACSGASDDTASVAGDPDPGQELATASPGEHNRLADRFRIPLPAPTTVKQACRSDAFCDDFESPDPASRWSGEVVTGGGAIAFLGPSASPGMRALRVTADAGAKSFLRIGDGAAPSAWSGAVGMTLKVDEPPAQRLAGPELVVGDSAIVISYAHDALVIEQRYGDTPVAAAIVGTPPFGAWQRVVVGVEVNPNDAAPYGRLEVSVNGGDLQPMPLLVPLKGGTRELHVGITSPDVAAAAAAIDDVMFFTK